MLQHASTAWNSLDASNRRQRSSQCNQSDNVEIRHGKAYVSDAVFKTRHSTGSLGLGTIHDAWELEDAQRNVQMHEICLMHKRCRTSIETILKVGWV
jgi:hypothetical protein